jgi:polysaccharide biosynthesis transport protein
MPAENQDLSQTVNQFLGLVIRRRWWLIATTCGVACAVALGSLFLPNKFTSDATLLVVQQQVPERYVVPNTTYSVRQALESLTEAVLSRSRLLPMINEFSLYPRERRRLGPDGLVQLMRHDVHITPVQKDPTQDDINAFEISFTCGDPFVAQKVTEMLTSFFIDENLKLQEQQDSGTTAFLKDRLAVAEQGLEQQEQRLREFRMGNLGELPDQEQGNLEILAGLHSQLQSTMAEVSRAQEQRVYLNSLLDQYQSLGADDGMAASGKVVSSNPVIAAEVELNSLESQREKLLASFTPEYPDVVAINQKISEQKSLLAKLKPSKGGAAASKQKAGSPAGDIGETSSEAQLRSQLDANRIQLNNLAGSEKQLEQQIAEYEQRLNATPLRQAQLSDIMRGYDLANKNYGDLLSKVTESEMATSLAERQQGQQFRVIDSPSLPVKPSSPKRKNIALGGAAAGLFLGMALAFLADSSDHSFYSERDLSQRFKLPLILSLPLSLTPPEAKRRVWRRRFEWAGATVLVMAVAMAEFYVLWKG